MKCMLQTTFVLMSVGAMTAMAQPPGGGPSQGSGTREASGYPQHGPDHGGPHGNPIMDALDVDGDHVISASELAGAQQALGKLDKNGDGKIEHDEVHPMQDHGAHGEHAAHDAPGEHGKHGEHAGPGEHGGEHGHMGGGPPGGQHGHGGGPGGPGGTTNRSGTNAVPRDGVR